MMDREAVIDLVIHVAERHGIPPDALLGLYLAESGLNPESERWFKWTDSAKRDIADGAWGPLQYTVNDIADVPSDDISFGLDQRTWRWSEEFQRRPGSIEERRRDWAAILAFREVSFDPAYAAERGAGFFGPLVEKYGLPEAFYRYNKPDGSASKAVKARYDKCWAEAAEMWEARDMAQEVSEFSFETEGFANKAAELGEDVVGTPIEAEHRIGKSEYVAQATTTGIMLYSEAVNTTYFFAAARPS